MVIKLKTLLWEAIGKIDVPKEPGTVPIPPNYVRLYHYTYTNPDDLRKDGLLLSKAKGHTYGEPDFVWSSTAKPERHKTYVEFAVPIDDKRFTRMGAAPDPHVGADFYNKGSHDFTMLGDVKPSEFIAIHEPWHHTYRYLLDNGYVQNVLVGEYDDILQTDKLPDEAKAIKAIKLNFGHA